MIIPYVPPATCQVTRSFFFPFFGMKVTLAVNVGLPGWSGGEPSYFSDEMEL